MEMQPADTDATQRLMDLLGPIHERAQLTARRLCRSNAEGDDLFQDAVVRALTRLADLREDRAFPAWFYRILLSLHRTKARRSMWRRWLSLDQMQDDGTEPMGDDGGRWEEKRHGEARMRAALATLPAAQRQAVVLADIDGCSLEEIAAMQGVSLSAVKSRVVRGRERLRQHYRKHHALVDMSASEHAWPAEGAAERGNPS